MQEVHAAHVSKPDQAKPVTNNVTVCVLVSIVSEALDEFDHLYLLNLIHHWVEKNFALYSYAHLACDRLRPTVQVYRCFGGSFRGRGGSSRGRGRPLLKEL